MSREDHSPLIWRKTKLLIRGEALISEMDVQPQNALFPMWVTLSGMVMLVSFLQSANAQFPMEVTLSGMTILVRFIQCENALYPMEVILLGSKIFLRFVQK